LNQLSLVASQVRAGVMKGERRSTKRGSSVEFADYRNYTPGDDLRRLDWNVFARLDRPFIKLLEEEEDLAVHLLVDASRSMDWGEAELHKFSYALKLAAALGAISLGAGDRLTIRLLREGSLDTAPAMETQFGPGRGSMQLLPMLAFLEKQTPHGETDLNRWLANYAMSAGRPGLAFVISDLFALGGYREGLSALQSRGFEVNLLQVLAPDEIDPPLAGDLRLVDVENGQTQEVSLDGGMRDLYRRRVQAWQEEILSDCRKRRIRYLPLDSSVAWDKVVLYDLRKSGVVK
jgi:uncharacterized protein (DUF58 family)